MTHLLMILGLLINNQDSATYLQLVQSTAVHRLHPEKQQRQNGLLQPQAHSEELDDSSALQQYYRMPEHCTS